MTFNPARGEKLATCPYDRSHVVSLQRVGIHLTKCRANYKKKVAAQGEEVRILPCRYNPAHHMIEVELEYHEKSCPDQSDIRPRSPPPTPDPRLSRREKHKFKKVLIMNKTQIEDDWEVMSVYKPAPAFTYDPSTADEAYQKAMAGANNGTRERAAQAVQKPLPIRFNPELSYLLESSDSDNEDIEDPVEREKRYVQDEENRQLRFAEYLI